MDPVWRLFSRRAFSRLAYWLSALGYDLRDHTTGNRIYLVYFCVFWFAWAMAVFVLLGSGLAGVFTEMQSSISPPQAVVTLAAYAIFIWAVVIFWQVSRHSPFVFSEEDAYLLCQTPASRRKVGLLWYLRGALGTCIPFAAGTIMLSFALVDWRLQGDETILRVFEYLEASLRAVMLVAPIVAGWQAGLWGAGALRLQNRKEPAWLRPAALGAAGLVLASVLIPGLRAILFAFLRLPIEAAFLAEVPTLTFLGGLSLSCLYLAAGVAFLSAQARRINLSQAAQETYQVALVSMARSYGQWDLVEAITSRRRLGTTRPPSRLLASPVGNTLFWKDLLQLRRNLRLRELINVVWVFGLCLGMFNPSNWAIQMVIAGVWTISIGGLSTRRLRSDLARWWLMRSLPLRAEEVLKYEIALSWALFTLISWLALALSNLEPVFKLYAAVLMPILAASAALAAAHDILRHCKARILMAPSLAEENVPRQNIYGVVEGLVTALIPFGMLMWSAANAEQPMCGAVAIPLAVLLAWLNRRFVLNAYRVIE